MKNSVGIPVDQSWVGQLMKAPQDFESGPDIDMTVAVLPEGAKVMELPSGRLAVVVLKERA